MPWTAAPPAILRYGIAALLGIISVLIIGSAFFSYPDTVDAKFTLTTQVPPAYIITKTAGRIQQLYVENKQPIREGDLIGVIQNTANTEDMLYLREKLKEWKASGSLTEQIDMLLFHRIPELGVVQTAYSSCLLAWSNYLQHMQENRIYETEVINAVASLQVALTEWETNYLLMSPVNGTIAFMQLWKPNQNVEAGETMFVVIPKDAVQPTGKALLPMEGIGKVEMGATSHYSFTCFSGTRIRIHRGTGNIHFTCSRLRRLLCVRNCIPSRNENKLWERTSTNKDNRGYSLYCNQREESIGKTG